MDSSAALGAVLAAFAVLGIALAALARPQFAKHGKAAASFVVPGVVALLAAGVLLVTGAGRLAIPAAAVATMFIAAGAIFLPTRATRFREFERRFWEHVLHHEQRLPR